MRRENKCITNAVLIGAVGWFVFSSGISCVNTLSKVGWERLSIFSAMVLLPLILSQWFRFLRYYLILSESTIHLEEYAKLYLKSTLVNILLPFKMGEIYRFYLVGVKSQSYPIALLSILTERFFDTFLVASIMLLQVVQFTSEISIILILFFLFAFCVFAAYIMLPTTLDYFNKYFIVKPSTKRDVFFLNLLSVASDWYYYAKKLIKGKGLMILLFSILSWIMDFLAFAVLGKALNDVFNLNSFSTYIQSIFVVAPQSPADFINLYSLYSIVILGLFYLVIIFFHNPKKEKQN